MPIKTITEYKNADLKDEVQNHNDVPANCSGFDFNKVRTNNTKKYKDIPTAEASIGTIWDSYFGTGGGSRESNFEGDVEAIKWLGSIGADMSHCNTKNNVAEWFVELLYGFYQEFGGKTFSNDPLQWPQEATELIGAPARHTLQRA